MPPGRRLEELARLRRQLAEAQREAQALERLQLELGLRLLQREQRLSRSG